MDKEHGKINLEEWVNKELIKANKINKYNQNIDNLWIQIEYLDSLIGESVESNKIIFHSGLEDVQGDTVEDFLNYVKNQLWLLGSAHIDINNSIKTVQTDINNLENSLENKLKVLGAARLSPYFKNKPFQIIKYLPTSFPSRYLYVFSSNLKV